MTTRFSFAEREPQSIESLPLVGRTSTRRDGAHSIGGQKMKLELRLLRECDIGDRVRFHEWSPLHEIRSVKGQRAHLVEIEPVAGREMSIPLIGDTLLLRLEE